MAPLAFSLTADCACAALSGSMDRLLMSARIPAIAAAVDLVCIFSFSSLVNPVL
jgi:hypothetical protein